MASPHLGNGELIRIFAHENGEVREPFRENHAVSLDAVDEKYAEYQLVFGFLRADNKPYAYARRRYGFQDVAVAVFSLAHYTRLGDRIYKPLPNVPDRLQVRCRNLATGEFDIYDFPDQLNIPLPEGASDVDDPNIPLDANEFDRRARAIRMTNFLLQSGRMLETSE